MSQDMLIVSACLRCAGHQGVPTRQDVYAHPRLGGGGLPGNQGAHVQAALHAQHEGEDWHGEPALTFLVHFEVFKEQQRILALCCSPEYTSPPAAESIVMVCL